MASTNVSTFLQTSGVRVAVAAFVLAAPATFTPAAHAEVSPTYTVAAGSQTSGHAAFSGQAIPVTDLGNYRVDFVNAVTGVHFSCSSSKAAGTVFLGTQLTGALARVDGASWSKCDSFAGLTLSIAQSGTLQIRGSGVTASGVTRILVTNLALSASGTGCSFNAIGTLDATYNNATAVLDLAPAAGSTRP